MKLVKECLYEIKKESQDILTTMGIGKIKLIKQWADRYIGEGDYEIENEIIYPTGMPWEVTNSFLSIIEPYIKIYVVKPFSEVNIGDECIAYGRNKDNVTIRIVRDKLTLNPESVKEMRAKYGDEVFGGRDDEYVLTNWSNESVIVNSPNFVRALRYGRSGGMICMYIYNKNN